MYYYLSQDKSKKLIRLPKSSLETSDGKHTEKKLLGLLPKEGCPIVVEVYTERWPCDNCESELEKRANEANGEIDIKVYFIAPAGSGDDITSADQLRLSYDKVFGLKWWD